MLYIDECATGTHNCHKDAICTNTNASYTCHCKPGLKGNGILCNERGKFKDGPQTVRIKINETVRLSCSYYHQDDVAFSWIKDFDAVNTGPSHKVAKKMVRATGLNAGSNLTTQYLEFNISKGEEQGYYRCKIDNVISTQATVFLKDASTTKLSLKVSQGYTAALNKTTSTEYKTLHATIKSQFDSYIGPLNNARRKRRNVDPSAVILRNVRSDGSGKTLLDAFIYYAPVSNTRKVTICSKMQNVTTANLFSSTTPAIELVQRITYDCCYGEWTGNADIKGVIGWPTQAILSNSTVACPYRKGNENASRQCVSNDFERQPTWKAPYDGNCLYVHESTRELSDLSQQTINASDVEQVVAKLENVTNKQENIRSYVDVSLAVDVITKVAAADKTNKLAFKGIVQVTDSLMSAKKEVVKNAQKKSSSSEKLVNAVEAFAENIPVPENETVIFKEKNLAVGVAVVEDKKVVQNGYFIKGNVDASETSLEMNDGTGSRDSKQVANIFLPGPLFTKAKNQAGGNASATRVTTFLYDNEKLFISEETSGINAKKKVNSRILAVSIKGIKLENLTDDQRIKSEFKALNKTGSNTVRCVYWEETTREWSQRGCRLDGTEGNISKCSCNHLTNFAILLDVEQKPSPTQPTVIIRDVLQYFTYIGCGLSLAALFITLVTFVVFKNLRKKDPQKILMLICISLILALVAFLVSTQYSERFTENIGKRIQNSPIICLVSSVTTHYFVLCSFFWMAMHSYYLYLSCVKVMGIHAKNLLKKMAMIAFGVPLVAVAIVVGVGFTDIKDYANQNDANISTPVYSTTNHYVRLLNNKKQQICMINGIPFYAAYLAPIGIVLIINFVLMILAFRGIYASSQKTKSKQMSLKRKIRMVVACISIMGLTWVFGIFAIGDAKIPFQIAFTVFNSLQGVFIFIFYCLLNPKVQNEWRKCLCGDAGELSSSSQRSQKSNTSSSFMSTKLRKLSGAFIKDSSKKESRKEREVSSNDESLPQEERARRYTNSLSALHQEFTGTSFRNESIFVQLRGTNDSYSFVGPGINSEDIELESFKKIERDPKLTTAL